MKEENDFYEHYNLVNEEDIEQAQKKKKKKQKMDMSTLKKGSKYETVSQNKEIIKEEILKEEVEDPKTKEEFLMEYNIVEDKKEEKKNPPIYIGFTPRLVIFIILVPILSLFAILFLYKSFEVDDIVNIRYTEKSIINDTFYKDNTNIYKVDNNLYDKSLVHKINLDLNYQMRINTISNLAYEYQVVGELFITEKDNPDKVLFTENYTLIDTKQEEIMNSKKYTLRENIDLDYWNYYNLAKQYAESYKQDISSYFDVELIVKYQSKPNNSYSLSNSSTTSIRIPLSESTIKVEKNELDGETRVDKRPTVNVQSPGYLGLGVLFSIGAILALSYAILYVYSILDQTSIYDRKVGKILKKYKTRIQEKEKIPRKNGKQVTHVESIKPLVSLSRKKNLPIEYCNINNHNKCQFSVMDGKELYIYIIKSIDLEKKD